MRVGAVVSAVSADLLFDGHCAKESARYSVGFFKTRLRSTLIKHFSLKLTAFILMQ